MKIDFITFCQEKGLPLPQTGENAQQAVKPQYPDAAARAQYPDGYFTPVTPTAILDIANAKKMKSVKGGKDTAAN